MPTNIRSYTAERFLLELDGVKCGFIQSAEGGGISAEVIQEAFGNNYFSKKHIGSVKYEDLILQIGLGMDNSVYDWIAAFWNGNTVRKDLTLFALDQNMQIRSQAEFFNVMISETTIPAMDGASKEPCYMTLRLVPEYSRSKKVSDKFTIKTSKSTGKNTQKTWLPSNFRLEINGVDCTRVSKLDAFTVKQNFVSDAIGDTRVPQMKPAKINFPSLKIALAEHFAQSWMEWHEDFVIKGNNGESQEKNGSLTFLSPNRTEELACINLFNLGIFRLAPEKAQAQSDQIKRITAEMYCERMEFIYPGNSAK